METEVIAKIKVSDKEFPETVYEVSKVGSELYLAKPEETDNSHPSIYIEKSSEGWQYFSPDTPASLEPEVPGNIIDQLTDKIQEYYRKNEEENPPSTVAF